MTRPPGAWRPWLSTVGLLAAWAVVGASGRLDPHVLPAPGAVLRAAWDLVADGSLPAALAVSGTRVAVGAGAGVAVGLLLGLLAGLSGIAHDVVDRPLQAVRAVPFTAVTPLLVVWVGLGEPPKVLLVAVAALVPTYLATVGGVRGVDPRLRELAAAYGLGRRRTATRVLLPAALPAVLVGLRLALGTAWVALVVAESVNAAEGVGALLTDARTYARTDVVLLCVLVYAALGLVTDALVRALERLLQPPPVVGRHPSATPTTPTTSTPTLASVTPGAQHP
ncbi:ABC transporter permease [Cellulomonas palmilytica]|uniref:ABC transporter permease n=1 Tax=Cellulomonas palmilytica TaxID=2608402 RepID=UPI001F1EC235|nr:ABC transporter permease [Cellulomonas palmilytica]UJP40114.1 ABC transporter permease [Cellulomonas palmilytica]